MMPTVLLYNIPPRKLGTIRVLATRLRLRTMVVGPEYFGVPLEELLQGQAAAASAESFDEEMLVMADMSGGVMDLFLQSLRRQKVPVALKAVVTETNRAWDGERLYCELCREREAFAGGTSAHNE